MLRFGPFADSEQKSKRSPYRFWRKPNRRAIASLGRRPVIIISNQDGFPARGAEYSEDVRSRLETGMKVLAVEYLEAQDQRRSFISQLREVMEKEAIDALMVPTTPIAAPLIGEETTRVGKIDHPTRALLLRLNRPANLAGCRRFRCPAV